MQSFSYVLVDTIQEVIRNVFDDEIAQTILKYVQEKSPDRLEEKVRVFSNALPDVLGRGAVIIQDLILETLYLKYGLKPQWKKDYSFPDYVLELAKETEGKAQE